MMPDYHLGALDKASLKILGEGPAQPTSTEPRPIFLDSKLWNKAVLHGKHSVSWDSRIFTFKLDHDEQEFGLPTGQHVMMRLKDPETKEAIIRSYTPISETSAKGYLDVLVKIYFDTPGQKGGKMTKALDALAIGDYMEFKGPIGKFQYLGRGLCSINGIERQVENLYMLCGGSGVTPIYQVFRAVMQDAEDFTNCVVLDGNRLEEDILCKEQIDEYVDKNGHKCKVHYTLTKATDSWNGLRGRVGAELLKEHFPKKDQSMVLICGPGAMEKEAQIVLIEQGWDEKDMLFF
jgi:nitrate reductase (NAD(P)H)